MASKNYCWSIGTTSFRTSQLNYKIERQLQLLEEFWNVYPSRQWDDEKNDEIAKKLNMSNEEKYPTQVLYYNFLKENGFLVGDASLRDKDARAKTSGLVNIGVLNNERKITKVGQAIKNLLNCNNTKENLFNISDDSYKYLLQFLKLQISNNNFNLKPFISLIYMIEKLDFLTYDEFIYLLPLCKNKNDIKNMVNVISNREALDIDTIISIKLFEMDNYIKMCSYFINAYPITEETFEEVGMSGKSKIYDRNYKLLYDNLVDLVFHLKNEPLEQRIDKYKLLYDSCGKISGNARKEWKNYLFFGYKKNNLDKVFDKKFKNLDISIVRNIKDFKKEFFIRMHVIKWKVNLKDYFDLNKRYFSLTDIIKFKDEKIELDMLPKYYFKDIIDDLLDEDLLENEKYTKIFHTDVELENISSKYSLNINDIVKNINSSLGTDLTINTINSYVENQKLKAFNKLIDEKFSNEKLLMLLDSIKFRNDDKVNEYVTDNATVPTIFEYIVGIAWYKISNRKGNILDYMNLSLDADLLPKTHAGGGMADIVYKYEKDNYPKHNLLIEATISESTGQRSMEMEPVSRHLGENIKLTNNKNDYALFVAPILEERIVMDFRNRKTYCYPIGNDNYIYGLKIIPINIDILKSLLINDVKYDDIYIWFDNAYKSLEPDPVWFKKEILEKA